MPNVIYQSGFETGSYTGRYGDMFDHCQCLSTWFGNIKVSILFYNLFVVKFILTFCFFFFFICNSKPKNAPLELRIQTFAPGDFFPFSILQSTKKMVEIVKRNPIQNSVWAPSIRMTTNMYLYFVWLFLVHIPMAIFYDALLILSKKKPM